MWSYRRRVVRTARGHRSRNSRSQGHIAMVDWTWVRHRHWDSRSLRSIVWNGCGRSSNRVRCFCSKRRPWFDVVERHVLKELIRDLC